MAFNLVFAHSLCIWTPLKSPYGEKSWRVLLKNLHFFSTEDMIWISWWWHGGGVSGNFNSEVNYSWKDHCFFMHWPILRYWAILLP